MKKGSLNEFLEFEKKTGMLLPCDESVTAGASVQNKDNPFKRHRKDDRPSIKIGPLDPFFGLPVTEPAPKLLDSDGRPISPGDIVGAYTPRKRGGVFRFCTPFGDGVFYFERLGDRVPEYFSPECFYKTFAIILNNHGTTERRDTAY